MARLISMHFYIITSLKKKHESSIGLIKIIKNNIHSRSITTTTKIIPKIRKKFLIYQNIYNSIH